MKPAIATPARALKESPALPEANQAQAEASAAKLVCPE
jgi:hypothetical protein